MISGIGSNAIGHLGAGVWGSFPSLHGLLRARAPRPQSSVRAFTIVEVLLSIAILSVGAVLVMQALARGAYAVTVADARTTVYTFASAKLADLDVAFTQGSMPRTGGKFTSDGTPFQWQLDTSPVSGEPELEMATLTVQWSQAGTTRHESFSTVRRVLPQVLP